LKRERVYVRFVCFLLVPGQRRQRLGLFQALEHARTSETAEDWALVEAETCNDWFHDHLEAPSRFQRGGEWGRPGQPGPSWFKADAAEAQIKMMHRLKRALEGCGLHVEVLTTHDPGVIIFEDEHQVVAEPGGRRF
jgi:hypothetical protein